MRTVTAAVEKCTNTGLYVGHVPGFPGAPSRGVAPDHLVHFVDLDRRDGEALALLQVRRKQIRVRSATEVLDPARRIEQAQKRSLFSRSLRTLAPFAIPRSGRSGTKYSTPLFSSRTSFIPGRSRRRSRRARGTTRRHRLESVTRFIRSSIGRRSRRHAPSCSGVSGPAQRPRRPAKRLPRTSALGPFGRKTENRKERPRGDPGAIRTRDPQLRRLVLYPG